MCPAQGKYAWRLQMQGLDGRAFQLGSDGSKLASTNGTFRVLDGNEKGAPGSPQHLPSADVRFTPNRMAPIRCKFWVPWS